MQNEVCETPGVKFLKPQDTQIFRGTFDMLHVAVKNDTLYRGVFAVYAFPIESPGKYVSLRYHDEDDKEQEIGVIEDLNEFDPDTRKLVLETLGKYYYSYVIQRIFDIKTEFGLLLFNVETDKGPRHFWMRWGTDRAPDFGKHGKVLLDVFEDRYVIPDMRNLPRRDRDALTRFVYW